jgi:hypothetical protein
MADGSISSFTQKRATTPAAAWACWVLPSVADLIFIVLVCSFCFTSLSSRLLNDAGTGWHIRTGQLILSTHHIPTTDPYSSIMAGKPWIAWEWLYDVLVGALNSGLGLNGVVWFTALVIAAVFSWTFHLIIARGSTLFLGIILILLAISASMIHILARPHVVTWFFAVMWYSVLDSLEREPLTIKLGPSSRRLWLLPISMILWVNLHGGFLLGFVFCLIFWVSALWTWSTSHGTGLNDSLKKIAVAKRLRSLSWVTLLSIAASFLNPYGWALHYHVFSYLTNRFLMDHVEEFQSPNFHLIAQRCFLLLLILAFATVAVRRRSLKVSELLLLLFAIYSGLYASRNIPVSAILVVLIVGPLLLPLGRPTQFTERMRLVNSRLRGHVWPLVAVIFVFIVDLNGGRLAGKLLADAHFDPNRMPVAAVDNLAKLGMSQPVLTPDYWGGYLIYRLYPQTQVVIDDRHDLYGEQVLAPYLKMIHAQPGWDNFLRIHNVSCAVIPRNSALSTVLSQTPQWKPIHSDDVAITFQRTAN